MAQRKAPGRTFPFPPRRAMQTRLHQETARMSFQFLLRRSAAFSRVAWSPFMAPLRPEHPDHLAARPQGPALPRRAIVSLAARIAERWLFAVDMEAAKISARRGLVSSAAVICLTTVSVKGARVRPVHHRRKLDDGRFMRQITGFSARRDTRGPAGGGGRK